MKGRGQNLKLVVHIAAVARNFSAKESTHLTRFSSSVLQAINSQGAARGDQAPQLSGFDVARVNPEIENYRAAGSRLAELSKKFVVSTRARRGRRR